MSVKHKTCQSALNKLFMHPGLWWNLSEIHVYLSYCCTVYSSSSFANFGGANGGTSKEDTHPLVWAQAHVFHPSVTSVYTEVDAVCRCHVGIWWSWPRRYCCGPCGNACCSAAWHFVTVFGSGWSAFWCCEKWGFNLAGEIETWSSVRYDNFPHKRDVWGKRGRCCLRVD